MTEIPAFPSLGPALPEIFLATAAMALFLLDLVIKKKDALAVLGVGCALATIYLVLNASGSTFFDTFTADGYARFFKIVFLTSLALVLLISIKHLRIEGAAFGEYPGVMLMATVGMMIMASSSDLIALYMGLELMALSTFILVGLKRHDVRSNEAAIKYFLLGAFSSAFLIFGISLAYGMTGTTKIYEISEVLASSGFAGNPVLMLSVIFMIVAFGFKVAAVPFHMWAPDVYEGAPTSVTAFLSVGPKAAGFAAMGRVLLFAFAPMKADWAAILIPIAIATMAVGNIAALAQTSIKRMLAYSSIAHAGYALLGVIAGTPEGAAGMMSYMMIYAFMNIGAFGMVILLRSEGFSGENLKDYEGLAKTHPLAAALMLVFMFSLTGIPPTAGFVGKLYLFMSLVNADMSWLVVVAVIFSAISSFFYLRVVMYMYMREPVSKAVLSTAPGINIAMAVSLAAVIFIGVMPGGLLDFAREAVAGF